MSYWIKDLGKLAVLYAHTLAIDLVETTHLWHMVNAQSMSIDRVSKFTHTRSTC